ncbi:MAG: type II secretion system protein GspM [Wenzhouxiangella sp.]
MTAQLSSYWNTLNRRQQLMLGAAGLVLGAALLFVWVWEPLAESRQFERERVASQRALLDWLEAVEPAAQALRQGQGGARDMGGRSLLGLADQTARAAGLAGALSRIEPVGENQVRVWLDDADFTVTMRWLETVSINHPVRAAQLDIERGRSTGLVNARVTLSVDG